MLSCNVCLGRWLSVCLQWFQVTYYAHCPPFSCQTPFWAWSVEGTPAAWCSLSNWQGAVHHSCNRCTALWSVTNLGSMLSSAFHTYVCLATMFGCVAKLRTTMSLYYISPLTEWLNYHCYSTQGLDFKEKYDGRLSCGRAWLATL